MTQQLITGCSSRDADSTPSTCMAAYPTPSHRHACRTNTNAHEKINKLLKKKNLKKHTENSSQAGGMEQSVTRDSMAGPQ